MPDSFDYTTGTNSENVRLLQALIDDAPEYTEETNSRNANILKSIINNTEYTDAPQSEIEELLLRLKAKIGGEIEVDELTVTENGTYDAGVNKAYNPVTVELPLNGKTITENGTYTASDDNLAGFNEVTVAVEGYAKKSISNTPTSIATFNASALPMPSLKVGIEAVQDLHGYDYPWPAGGGKNKFDKSTVNVDKYIGADGNLAQSQYNQDVTDYIPVVSGQTYMISHARNTNNYSCFYDENKTMIGSVFANNQFPIEAPTNAKYMRVTFGKADVDAFQVEIGTTSTAYAPYYNICPISGFTEANVIKTGKNLYGGIDFANSVKDASPNGAIDTTNKTVTYSYGTGSKTTIFDTFKPLTSYTFLFKVADCGGQNSSMRIVYTDGTTEGIEILTSNIGNYARKVSAPNKTVSRLDVLWYQSTSVKLYYDECGIFEGNIQATDFEPYNGTTYTTTLKDSQGNPLTCYGGTLSNENGVQRLVLTQGHIASYNGETLPSTWISDRDVYAEGTTPTTGAEVVYTLATPQTIPQDNLAIATQDGTNNLWADTGDVLEGSYFKEL